MKIIVTVLYLLLTSILHFGSKIEIKPAYDSNYVMSSSVEHQGESYCVVYMKRTDKRVRAKYFAKKLYGKSVANRYQEWSAGRDIILYSSGTYMDGSFDQENAGIVGLTVDNGHVINEKVEVDRMEGLVIVYPHGGITVSNISEGNLELTGGSAIPGKLYDLKKGNDKVRFLEWAKNQRATVFQTHLLVHDNELKFKPNYTSKSAARERRFLAIGKDYAGKEIQCIIHKPQNATLYDASNKVFNFLKTRKRMAVTALLNLDTGAQDVFRLYNKSGSVNNMVTGRTDVSNARNLLVYYFE